MFPTRSVGETSKKLPKRLEQTWPLRFLPCVKALSLQSFLNLLVMDDFHALKFHPYRSKLTLLNWELDLRNELRLIATALIFKV